MTVVAGPAKPGTTDETTIPDWVSELIARLAEIERLCALLVDGKAPIRQEGESR